MTEKGSTAEHTALLSEIRKQFGREPGLCIHLNARGTMRTVRGVSQFIATPGLGTGSLDLVCMLRVELAGRTFAQWVEVDAKTGNAQPSKEQRLRISLVRSLGGFACTVRSVEEFGAALQRARDGQHS